MTCPIAKPRELGPDTRLNTDHRRSGPCLALGATRRAVREFPDGAPSAAGNRALAWGGNLARLYGVGSRGLAQAFIGWSCRRCSRSTRGTRNSGVCGSAEAPAQNPPRPAGPSVAVKAP